MKIPTKIDIPAAWFGDELKKLASEMLLVMRAADGI